MIKEGKFGVQEAVALITITSASKVFLSSPGILARFVGTATWYTTLISTIVGIIGFTFIYLLLKRFSGKDIVEIFDIVFGKYIGFIFSFVLAAWMLFFTITMLREFTEIIKVYVLPVSPSTYIIAIFILVMIILSYLGIEAIARFARFVAYGLVIALIAVLLLAQQNYEIHRIFPIYGYGIKSILLYGTARSSGYGEVIILAAIAGCLQGPGNIKKAGFISLILSGLVVSASMLAFTLAFPYYTAQEITSPMYELTSLIDYGRFFSRLDPIFLFLWNISSLIAISTLFYTSISVYCKLFRFEKIRPAILPFAILVFYISISINSIVIIVLGLVQKIREYGWIVFFVFPLTALITAAIRKKGGALNA